MPTYIPLGPLPPQFQDTVTSANLSDGTLEFYEAGTATPTNLFSDNQGTSIGTSITLNSGGFPESGGNVINLWRDDTVDLKLVLKNAAGASVATVDNIPGAANTRAVPFYDQTTAESTAGVTPSDKQYEPGNVLRYGADDSGSTSSSTAFANAFSAYNHVYAPEGVYKLDSLLQVPSSGVLMGDGFNTTRFDLSGVNGGIEIEDYGVLAHLRINGDGTSGQIGLRTADSAARWRCFDVRWDGADINVDISNAWSGEFFGCIIAQAVSVNVKISQRHSPSVVNIIAFHGGVIEQAPTNVEIDNQISALVFYATTIQGATTYGIHGTSNSSINTMLCSGSWLEDNADASLLLENGGEAVALENSRITLSDGASDKGVETTGGTVGRLRLTNNQFGRKSGGSSTSAVVLHSGVQFAVMQQNSKGGVSGLDVTDNTTIGVTFISDEFGPGTKLTGVNSVAGGTRKQGNNFAGTVLFGSADTTKAVSFGTDEPDTNYYVIVASPSWDPGSVWVTSKAVGGFTINFTNSRGSGSENVLWMLVRR